MPQRPNILFVFADQWRARSFGYAGDPNVKTPHIDRFASESVNFSGAVSGCPVCTPYRASLMTGVYPHKHKLMVNDQCLVERYDGPFLADCLKTGGYATAYIGKWHIDGKGRNAYVPPERRLGFDWWKGFECCHDYNNSHYYTGTDPRPHRWKGYDADSQTEEACRYLREEVGESPFALFLSWGPPHNPFGSAPEKYEAMYDPADLVLPGNVPPHAEGGARKELAGYYAHCTALDDCFGRLMQTLADTGLDEDTIVIFTSDHGDMLGSQGAQRKQVPYAESNRVPFLVRHPAGRPPCEKRTPIDAPDLMPTLLSLAGVEIPEAVQGTDFSSAILTGDDGGIKDALLAVYVPFHEWVKKNGAREYRGLQTETYTYTRTLEGPWLLYNHETDPEQTVNLAHDPAHAELVRMLDERLTERLARVGDDFAAAEVIVVREGYALNSRGDILITPSELPEPHPE